MRQRFSVSNSQQQRTEIQSL
ncbi:hypothetical protein CBM2623_A190077 [Cupriavidus taiwanensis]|nr:hypothetical protein CBM2623_A190077 [Cupriavidus taiwanensis]